MRIERHELARLLGAVTKVVESRNTIPILSSVRLVADGEGAIALRGKYPAEDLYRVAEDCLRIAGVPQGTDEWLHNRRK
jgi:hypothetical protein